jgi:hemoglobin
MVTRTALLRLFLAVPLAASTAALNGCQTDYVWRSSRPQMALAGSQPLSDESLFVRLGGKPAIEALVDDLLARVVADLRINSRFAAADLPHLKTMMIDQICQASGGPCVYEGRDMKITHAGMAIGGEEFDALVGDLMQTMEKFEIGRREQTELLTTLRAMKTDIVDKSMTAKP